MSRSDPHNQVHPDDLLEAYSLNALEDPEALQLESHLEGCERCRLAVAGLHHAVSFLGQSVVQQQPPPGLRLRLRRALGPSAAPSRAHEIRPIWRLYRPPVARFLLPTAAAIMVALFSVSVVMNVSLSNRTGDLERENSALAAQVAMSRVANYWLANPENLSISLTPPDGAGTSSGILVVDRDGRQAILLLADMEASQRPATYDVWLMRGEDKVRVGQLQVDEAGWGAGAIEPSESVYGFDRVGLTEETAAADARASNMVLEGRIAARGASPRYTLQMPSWR